MRRVRLLTVLWLTVVLVLAACGGKVAATAVPPAAPAGGAGPTATLTAEERLPDDIPIYEGAARLAVGASGLTVSYSVNAPLQDVFDWYKAELTARGWEEAGGSESLFGQLGTILRTKGNARLTVTLNGNPKGDDVFIQINTSR